MSEKVIHDGALYRRLSKPFRSYPKLDAAVDIMFRMVEVAREAAGLPEVVLIVAARVEHRPADEMKFAVRYLHRGDSRLLRRLLTAALDATVPTPGEPTIEEGAAPAAGGGA